MDALSISEDAARLDPSLARGLEYYTGPVFEGALPHASVGSVMGGGRYDGLVNRFRNEAVGATGASIGLDRLVTGLTNVGLASFDRQATALVFVPVMPGVAVSEAARVAGELRAGGIATELYVGEDMGRVGRQLSFANARGACIAVLLGEEELSAGNIAVKDLREGINARADITDRDEYREAGTVGQQTVARTELISTVRRMLG